jgi:hypothetical protein
MQLVWGFLFAVVVMAGGALAVTYTGAYNVAANVPDSAVAKWLVSTNMKQSAPDRRNPSARHLG